MTVPTDRTPVRASILIPTHNHADTLPITVESALAQSVRDLEVIIIGDGVTPDVRAAAEGLAAVDARVRFLDRPKGPSHGEIYRDEAIRAARSDAIFYLCDDDLLLPEHVADLLELLETHNFVQCMNSFITTTGQLELVASDLSEPRIVLWHVTERPFFNSTSLTGTAHSKEFYLRVGQPWSTALDGCPPDVFQWRRLMAHPDFSGATSRRVTALQLPTSMGREAQDQSARAAELARWAAVVADRDAQQVIDGLAHQAAMRQLVQVSIGHEKLRRSVLREWSRPSRRVARGMRRLLGRPTAVPPDGLIHPQ